MSSRLHGRESSRDASRLQSRLHDDFSVLFSKLTVGAPLPAGKLPCGGTYVQAAGANQTEETVQTSASAVARWAFVAHLPRIGMSPAGRVGLYRDPPRTNTAMRNIQQHAWSAVGITIGTDGATAPDGTATAEVLNETATTNVHTTAQTLAAVLNEPYCISGFMKQRTRRYAGLRFSTVSGHEMTVDLQTKAAGTLTNATLVSLTGTAGGWIRAALRCTPSAGASSSAQTYLASTSGVYGSYLGDLSAVDAWGFQVEPLAEYPSSLIITAATTAARAGSLAALPLSSLVRAGRLRYRQSLDPLGASDRYASDGATVRLWTIDTNTYAEIATATRVLTVCVNGVARVAAVAVGWSAASCVEWSWEVGGGALRVRYRLSTDAGVTWTLPFDPFGGTAYTDAAISTVATSLHTLSDGVSAGYLGAVEVEHERLDVIPSWVLQALPSDVASVRMWLRSDGGVTLNSTTVSAWGNQCALGGSVSQGTAGNQPTYSATSGPGGIAALDFDGSADVLVGSAVSNYLSASAFEIHAAVRWDTLPAGASYTASPVIAGDSSGFVDLAASASGLYQGSHDGGFKSALAAGLTTGAWTRVRGRLSGGVLGASINGGAETTTAAVGNVTSLANTLIIGARSTYFLDGRISDVILANAALTSGELAQLASYFTARGLS